MLEPASRRRGRATNSRRWGAPDCSLTLPRSRHSGCGPVDSGESPTPFCFVAAAPPALSTAPHLALVPAPSSGPLRSPSDFPLRQKRLRPAERWRVRHGAIPSAHSFAAGTTCRWAGTSLPCAAPGLVDAVSVCLAGHATPLRDASGTALLVRASCVLVVTPAGGLSDGWFMRIGSASSGTGTLPDPPHRAGNRPAACSHSPGHEEAPGREPPRHRVGTRHAPPPR